MDLRKKVMNFLEFRDWTSTKEIADAMKVSLAQARGACKDLRELDMIISMQIPHSNNMNAWKPSQVNVDTQPMKVFRKKGIQPEHVGEWWERSIDREKWNEYCERIRG